MADSSQKFIARNRAPRVQIEYDVELYGAEKKVQLPFVMGVMSDLSGKSEVDQGSVDSRKFLEIDVDNFDERMKAMAPRAAFTVPNTLTGEGNMAIDLTFEKISDFEPGAIAARVEALRPLLEARQQLSYLMTYMDGKAGAEALIEKVLGDPALLGALAAGANPQMDAQASALDALRAVEIPEEVTEDASAALESLRAADMADTEQPDESAAALEALRSAPVEPEDTSDDATTALDALKANAPLEETAPDQSAAALDGLRAIEVPEEAAEDGTSAIESLRGVETPEVEQADDGAAALAALRAVEITEDIEDDQGTALEALRAAPVAPEDTAEEAATALEALKANAPPAEEVPEHSDAALDALRAIEVVEETEDTPDTTLDALRSTADEPETPEDGTGAALDALRAVEVETLDAPDAGESALDALRAVEVDTPVDDTGDDALEALRAAQPDDPAESAEDSSALDALRAIEVTQEPDETADLALDALRSSAPDPVEEEADTAASVLAGLEPVEEEAATETTEDVLASIEAVEDADEDEGADDILAGLEPVETPEPEDDIAATLAGLETPTAEAEADDLDDILAGIEAAEDEAAEEDDLGDIIAGLDAPEDESTLTDAPQADDLDDLMADLDEEASDSEQADDDLDDLMAAPDSDEAPEETDTDDDLDALMAGLDDDDDPEADAEEDDLDALLGDLEDTDDPEDDLDDLMAAPDSDEAPEETDADDDLDALMAGLDDDDDPETATEEDDLAALLSELEDSDDTGGANDDDDDLADLMAGLDDSDDAEPASQAEAAAPSEEPELAYGQMGAARPDPQKLERKRFRLAILGDFTGRSARGEIAVGDALAGRAPILLDPDTAEEVIEGFATTLVLPIGKDGAGVEIKLKGLDDLHPDELYEKVEIFSALRDLKSQLSHGGTAENAAKSLKAWGEAHGRHVSPPRAVSGGNTVRADLKLSDFQKLIGDRGRALAQASPVDDLLARIVGPHIRKLPDPNATAMAEAVDRALSDAMRMVLHHPEFQSVEAQWRSIDLIARSIETDDTLDVMLYDISAEEIAADLTQSDDLSTSGFARLLTEGPMNEETGRGAYSAIIGMYTFEETPPHAQLLGRIARVAAHVDAPFFAAITPGFIEIPKKDRHPLVATEWDRLRAMPEAGHLALVSPRFLMRRPYGAKTEPIYEFDFEEFTQSAGLSGMLWANPVVLVAILLARSFRQNGPHMGLGQIMSLGDMPYHYVQDRYGDQVALPCTERNLTLDKVETVLGRGYLPVISIKGRDEIRLGSFQSLAGGDVLGPWSAETPPPPSPPKPPRATQADAEDDSEDAATDDSDLDDLLSGFDLDADDSDEDIDNDDDMDAELAALLADL